MLRTSLQPGTDTGNQRLDSLLAQPAFEGLKAILDRLSIEPTILCDAIKNTQGYEEFLAKLGFKLILTTQIHINDCYSRLSPSGGIKAVIPYYDIPTQGSMPTLVNLDRTVTTTPKALAFFNPMFLELKKQLASAA